MNSDSDTGVSMGEEEKGAYRANNAEKEPPKKRVQRKLMENARTAKRMVR